ncbi:hypothetical protein [Azospirillum largimobile]
MTPAGQSSPAPPCSACPFHPMRETTKPTAPVPQRGCANRRT